MKKFARNLVWLLLLSGVVFSQSHVVEEIVAIVNDEIITLSQYKQHYESMIQMLRAQYQGSEYYDQVEQLKKQLLDMIINEMLLLQLAKEKQINVSEQVKVYVENIIKENRLESEAELRRELARQNIDYNDFVRQIEENLLKQAVISTEVDRTIVLEESELIKYYQDHPEEFTEPEEITLKAIFLSSENHSEQELEVKKKEIDEKLAAGEEFDEVAALLSDPPLKELKGNLGTFKKGELESSLQAATNDLRVGEISPWLKAKNGWYRLKLEERKESRLKTFEEVRRLIEEKIFMDKRQKKIEEFIKNLRDKSYIKILKPNPLG
ncbi:MAG: peptidyl-prolyl cis-trans isomerase [Candidatus Aminicenantes bacterium]|nr:peptidyl-prolyl cis-trans isomerase [Candidatus Aminicenantes bacterium]